MYTLRPIISVLLFFAHAVVHYDIYLSLSGLCLGADFFVILIEVQGDQKNLEMKTWYSAQGRKHQTAVVLPKGKGWEKKSD